MKLLAPLCLSTACLVSACGGGGGDASPTASSAAVNSPEGAYHGTTSLGMDFTALVLDKGIMWVVYGDRVNSAFYVQGIGKGTNAVVTASSYSTTFKDYYRNSVYSGTLSANYVPGQSFNGASSAEGITVTFASSAVSASDYDYNVPASIASVTGVWPGTILNGQVGYLEVTSNGAFNGSIGGCSLSGQLAPRPGGKNVFDASILFGSSPCIYAGQRVSGNAVSYPLPNGVTQLVIAATTSDGSAGSAFLSQR